MEAQICMTVVKILEKTGSFAENKDVARELRQKEILPILDQGEEVTLDFSGVESTTQSFIHALISDILRKKGPGVLDRLFFKNCNETVQKLIKIVIVYMQETE